MKKILSSLLSKTLAIAMILSLTLSGCSGSLFLPIVEEYEESNDPVEPATISLDVDGVNYYSDEQKAYSTSSTGEFTITVTTASSNRGWSEYTVWEDAILEKPEDPVYTDLTFSDGSADISYTLSSTDEGEYDINVLLRNGSGEESDVASITIVLDRTAPEFTLKLYDSNGNDIQGYTSQANFNLNFLYIDESYEYRYWRSDSSRPDDYNESPSNDSIPVSIATDGSEYFFYAQVKDLAGNESSIISTETVTYNTTAPSFSFTINNGDSNLTTTSRTIAIQLSSYDSPSNIGSPDKLYIWVRTEEVETVENLDVSDATSYNVAYDNNYEIQLPDEYNDYFIYVNVQEGDTYSSPIHNNIRYDNIAPSITSYTLNGSTTPVPTNDGNLGLAVTATDNLADDSEMELTYWTGDESDKPDEPTWESLSGFTQPQLTADGTYNVWIQVRDDSGNESAAQSLEITYDGTAPEITSFLRSEGSLTNSQTIAMQLTASEDVTAYKIWDGDDEPSDSEYTAWTSSDGDITYTLPDTDGDHTVRIQVRDEAGNESDVEDINSYYTITYDSTAPTLSFEIDGGYGRTNSRGVTLTITTSSDVTGIKVWETSEPDDFSSYTSSSFSYTLTSYEDDSYSTVNMRVQDEAGNESNIATDTILYDITVGSTGLSIDQGTTTAQTQIDLTLTAESDVSEMKLWHGDLGDEPTGYSDFASTVSDYELTDAVDGDSFTFYLKVRDLAGNESDPADAQATITYNSNAPEVELTVNGGDSTSTTGSLSLALSTTAPSGTTVTDMKIWISPDETESGVSWESVASTASRTLSSQGEYAVNIKVRNDANVESGIVSVDHIYDSTAPVTASAVLTVNGISESFYTSSTELTLEISGVTDNIDVHEMKIWSGDIEPADSSYETYAASATHSLESTDDDYTVHARFRDETGNESAVLDSATVILDTIAPTVNMTADVSSPTNSGSVTISFNGADSSGSPLQIQYWADTDSVPDYSDYVATWTDTISARGQGDHTYHVRLQDGAGNTVTGDTLTIEYDSIAPSSTMEINGGDMETNTTAVTLNLDTDDSDITGYKVWEGSEPTGYTAYTDSDISYDLTSYSNGSDSTVNVRLRDEAGNESALIQDSITFDSVVNAPTLTITEGSSTSTTLINLSLSADSDVEYMKVWHTVEPVSYSAFADTISNYELTDAVSGTEYTLYLKVMDDAGNESDPLDAQASITYNSNNPEVALEVNSGIYISNVAQLDLDITPTAPSGTTVTEMKIWISPDETEAGTSWETINTTATRTLSSEGTYTVNVKVRNDAGLESDTASIEYDYDVTAPDTTSAQIHINGSTESSYTNSTSLDLVLSGITDNTDVYEMKIWSGSSEPSDFSYETYSSSATYTLSSTDGSYTIHARFRDEAGNISSVLDSASVILDTVDPVVNMTSDITSPTNSDTITLTFNGTDSSPLEIQYWADTDAQPDYIDYVETWTDSLSARGEGDHTYHVRIRDAAGNIVTGSTITVEYDITVPTFTMNINEGDNKTNINGVTLNLTTTHSDIAGYKVWEVTEPADYTTYTSSDISYSLSSYTDGSASTVYMKLQDDAGNESDEVLDSIIFDNSIGVPTITIDQGSLTAQELIDLTLSADGDVTEMKVWHGSLVEDEPSSYSSYSDSVSDYELTGAVNGTDYTLYLKVRDDTGNESDPADAQATITYNSETPEVTLIVNEGNHASTASQLDMQISTTAPTGTTVDRMKIWISPDETEPVDWETISASETRTLSSEGTYTINIKIINNADVESGIVTQEYIYDETAPDISGASISVNGSTEEFHTNNSEVTLAFSGIADNIELYEMKIWTGATEPADSSYTSYSSTTSLSLSSGDAPYEIHARFRDEAGNESTVLDAATVTLDTTNPTMDLTSDVSSPTNADSVTITINGSDLATMEIQYWVDSETEPAYSAYTATWTDDLTVRSEGQHTYHVRLRDEAGNTTHDTYSLTYDVSAPIDLTLEVDGDSITNSLTVDLTLSSGSADTVAFWTDSATRPGDATFEDFSTTKAYTLPDSDGYYDIYAAVCDEAGNESDPVSVSVTLDRVAPEFYMLKVADTYNGSSTTTTTDGIIYVSPITDEGSWMKVWFQPSGETAVEPSGDYIAFESNYMLDLETAGTYVVYCLVQDEAGNGWDIGEVGSSADITY